MQKITTLIIITFLSIGLNAQSLLPIKYGFKVGSYITDISSKTNNGIKNIDNTSVISFCGGFYMEIAFNDKWYIKPELIYTQKGSSFTYNYIHDYELNERDFHISNNELKLDYIELAPTLSFKTTNKLSLNFGPTFSFLLKSDYKIINDNADNQLNILHENLPDAEFQEEIFDVSLNLGVSYSLSDNLLFDIKVMSGFMSIGKISKEIYTGSDTDKSNMNIYDFNSNGYVFSLAYLF